MSEKIRVNLDALRNINPPLAEAVKKMFRDKGLDFDGINSIVFDFEGDYSDPNDATLKALQEHVKFMLDRAEPLPPQPRTFADKINRLS